MRIPLRAAFAALALALALPAAAHAQAVPGNPVDAVMSSNVEYLGSLKADVGLTTGARIVGKRLYVTSGKNISIYDISTPENPQLLGILPNVIWENEEVATNSKVLVFASDWYSFMPDCFKGPLGGCIQIFDVRDPASPKLVQTIQETNHTAECILDCTWIYGQSGTIVHADGVLDGKPATVSPENWRKQVYGSSSGGDCHHIREISPGIILTACDPFAVLSVLPKDGGSPEHPAVLYEGSAGEFVHSARWPNGGTDDLVLIGSETNFTGQCSGDNGDFRTYSAKDVLAHKSDDFGEPLDSIQPAGNGTYTDGKPVANHLGCSVHWFQEHPTFHNGGLVALSEYEDGVHFLQVKADGKIVDQGFFEPLGGSSSSPKWVPGTDIVYSMDYDRGIDILRWKGSHYEPTGNGNRVRFEKGRVRGINGKLPPRVLNKAALARRARLESRLRSVGWFPGYCRLAASRHI